LGILVYQVFCFLLQNRALHNLLKSHFFFEQHVKFPYFKLSKSASYRLASDNTPFVNCPH